MFARAGILTVCLLLPLLAGCLKEETGPDKDNGIAEPPAPPEPENNTFTFYLLFPEECPEEPIGFTTYNNTIDMGRRHCGPNPVEQPLGGQMCASFLIHDDLFLFRKGDGIKTDIAMETFPGIDSARFTWHDDLGIIAESSSQEAINHGVGGAVHRSETNAERDSEGPIWLDITMNEGRCSYIHTGESTSEFVVVRK